MSSCLLNTLELKDGQDLICIIALKFNMYMLHMLCDRQCFPTCRTSRRNGVQVVENISNADGTSFLLHVQMHSTHVSITVQCGMYKETQSACCITDFH